MDSQPIAKKEALPEPWLRGTLRDLPAEQRAVLHALQLAREDVDRWYAGVTEEELWKRPHNLPSLGFQLRHIAGSLDRLLTYAEKKQLSEEQKREMSAETEVLEGKETGGKEIALAEFHAALARSESRIRSISPADWQKDRAVGRKQLPTTVAGLMIHCAEHTQRHVGQAVTTAKVLLSLRGK